MHARVNHSSFLDFLEFASRAPKTSLNLSRETNDSEWAGTPSFAHALALARDGWPQGLSEIAKYRAHFSAIIGNRIKRPQLAHAVVGFSPDVGAFLSNEPECMFAREIIELDGPGKVLRVVLNGTVSGGISTRSIVKRGAMACALVDALECAGYSCEIVAAFKLSVGDKISDSHLVPVKDAGASLELDRVAFALAHPSMFRRLVFSACEQNMEFSNAAGRSYGMPTPLHKNDRGDIYFDDMLLGNVTDETVSQWFNAKLSALGVELSNA